MTEEIIFKASVDTGDTVNDLNAITKANERVSDSGWREANCHAAILSVTAQELWSHRFHFSAEHRQVHERAGREFESASLR